MECSVNLCWDDAYCKGLCRKHYKRMWRHGNPELKLVQEHNGSKCATPDCGQSTEKDIYCNACYRRIKHHGSAARLIAEQGTGRPETNGYVLLTINGERIYEHRHVMEQKLGRKLRPEEVVHHDEVPRNHNAPEKLMLFANQSEHMKYHARVEDRAEEE